MEEHNNQISEAKNNKGFVPIISAITIVLLGIFLAVHSNSYQSTDDAFVEGHVVSITPKIAGKIINIYAKDNQEVKENQVIAEIDPNDYQIKLEQAKVKLSDAKAKLSMSEKQIEEYSTKVEQTTKELNSTKSKLDLAEKDYKRYAEMYKEGIVSKQEYDNSLNQLTVSQKINKAANEKSSAIKSALTSGKTKIKTTESEITRLESEVEQADINLSHTKIHTPEAGRVSSLSVAKGSIVQIAQPLMTIVPQRVWVIANFNENQLTNMKKGQKVLIKVESYPSKKFKGKVDNIPRTTGAKQRVPVKITFEEDISKYNITPGMSVAPKVKIK